MTNSIHWARGILLSAILVHSTAVSAADQSTSQPAEQVAPERWAIHGQMTYVEQNTDGFSAPYSGPNSLLPSRGTETADATLYAGVRLWPGMEAWINPEFDQGFGLDDTLGVAGFPSGEAYKVGRNRPYFRLQRLFLRDTIDLGGAQQPVAPDLNQLGGFHGTNRWVFTLGKLSVVDIFDTNQYAHDPRNDFLNWAAADTGSFDYAADAWGYTVGAAAEWYHETWTVRAGLFDLSNVPNSEHLEPGLHELQLDLELEKRHEVHGHPGKVMLTMFDSRARMGLLDEAVATAQATGNAVDIAAMRRLRDRIGIDFNLEQELAQDLGIFARAGKAAGNVETYEFTEIDRTIALGLSLKGSRWTRGQDTLGIAGIVNHISAAREQYLNAGGLGIIIGDGQLPRAGPEQIVETYYSLGVLAQIQVSLDYQFVTNPAYNRDRGPVSIFALRVHAQL